MDMWTSVVFNILNNRVDKQKEIFESNSKLITPTFLNKHYKDGITLIGMAVNKGDVPMVKLLLKHGCNTETKIIYRHHRTAFDCTGAPVIFHAINKIENGKSKLSKILLRHGADINAKNSIGQSLLHIACQWGNEKTVRFLLRHKIDINAKDNLGNTVLMTAFKYYNSKITNLLLKHKPNIHAKNNKGQNVLHFCNRYEECPHLFKWFILKGVQLCKDEKGFLPFIENAHRHTSIIQFLAESKHCVSEDIIEYEEKALANNIIEGIDSTLPLLAQRYKVQQLIKQREVKGKSINPHDSAIAKAIGIHEIVNSENPRIFGNVEFITLQAFFYFERITGYDYHLISNIIDFCSHCESLTSAQQFKLCNTPSIDFNNLGIFSGNIINEHTLLLKRWIRQKEFLKSVENLELQNCLLTMLDNLLSNAEREYIKGNRLWMPYKKLEHITLSLGLLLLLKPEKCIIQKLQIILTKISDFCFKNFKSDFLQSILLAQGRSFHFTYFIADLHTTHVVDFLLILLGTKVATTRNKFEFLIHSAARIEHVPDAKLMVSKLLKAGCHHDTRDNKGYTYYDIFKSRGIENQHKRELSLQCLTAREISKYSIDYSQIPKALQTFVELH